MDKSGDDSQIKAARITRRGAITAALITATAGAIVAVITYLVGHQQGAQIAPTQTATVHVPAPGKVFDHSALEGDNGVKKVLISSYNVPKDQIQSVSCPANQEVKQGTKFQCTIKLGEDNPSEKVVDITVRNDNGEYEVGTPRDK